MTGVFGVTLLLGGGGLVEDEFLYFHFQKRDFATPEEIIGSGSFWLANNGCVPKRGPAGIEDVDRYNAFSPLREARGRIARERFVWGRRFNKYVFHR